MASIKQRGNSYQITVSIGRDSSGKKIIETTTYIPEATSPKAIEKEVAEYARDFEKRIKEGKFLSGEKITLIEFIKSWRENWADLNLKQRACEEYVSILEKRFIPTIGTMKLAKIKAFHIDSILTQMTKNGYAPKTVKYCFTAINSVMKYAYRMGVIEENVCDRCSLPKLKKDTSLHYFTLNQAKTFLNAIDTGYTSTHKAHSRTIKKTGETYTVPEYTECHHVPSQFKAFFMLAIYGGFRRGELIALTWNDIDYQNRSVTISKSVTKTKDGPIVKEPKTVSGNRTVILPKDCFDALRKWQIEEMMLCKRLGSAWQGSAWDGRSEETFKKNNVFIQIDSGLQMNLDTPYHKFREIIENYNSRCENENDKLPVIRLHDLRHTSATLLIANGTDIATVSKRLGHSRTSITLDVYTHAMEENDLTASNTLETLFSKMA